MVPRFLPQLSRITNPPILSRRIPFAFPLLYIAAHYAVADHALAVARRALDAGNLTVTAPAADLWYSRALLNAAQKSSDIRQRLSALRQVTVAARRATQTA